MKKSYPYSFLVLLASLFLSATLSAQETKVTVKVEKDGKTVKDTTYTFDDADQAEHAMKMMEIMSGDSMDWISEGENEGDHVKVMKYKVESGDHPHGEHVMVIKSDDDETFDMVIDEDSDHIKKITVTVCDEEDGEWEMKKDGGKETEVEVIIVQKKEVKENKKESKKQ